ncbi:MULTISPECIES: LacI family DNA-binding transcriptional regulator [unclassified Bradyrhizobium]|uniref:LacI family DNA-binding transcriptional regulator n=1 Tax=unclassified Bradyrhizobium TaxID=2631580 RepID=UPI001FF7DC4C|nr:MULTISPECIES: LacI family DNA-binding transcriptional regulator [unclassified Bradyrhizobium]MCK1279621.1 LacI family DNA-binding transcriptional regulator [Bradyrhizobium sp. 61]MCK1446356.1 LacI family DNA-binding transcriptional regulator [Bradyrhizobium sp. 48]MCK1465652.1 LacI family DNA-binding transcriptional regulator [Bradyrhizobium sp. 2]
MITAKDLANELQLSVSTVGRALANDSRISLATRQRVTEAAFRAGYVANRAAQMMRGASSKLVGLMLPDLGNSQYSIGAHALSKCMEAAGYQLVLSETNDDPAAELRHLRELCSAGVAGIVIVPSVKPLPESVRLLKKTPYVQLIRRSSLLYDQWFCFDNVQALRMATRHLLELGHSRIAYIGPPRTVTVGQERLEGFLMAQDNLPIDEELTIFGPGVSSEFGRQALRRLLDLKHPPTGLVLGSLQITRGILDEVVDGGIQIPQQLSVVGFSDEPGFRWWGPGLTTISVPNAEITTACGLWLIHQMKQGASAGAASPYGSVTPGKLVVRGSTGSISVDKINRRARHGEPESAR